MREGLKYIIHRVDPRPVGVSGVVATAERAERGAGHGCRAREVLIASNPTVVL